MRLLEFNEGGFSEGAEVHSEAIFQKCLRYRTGHLRNEIGLEDHNIGSLAALGEGACE